MSAGVSGIPAAGLVVEWSRTQRAGGRAQPFAHGSAQPSDLHLPEEQAFDVATINERLANLTAQAAPAGSALDIKA